LAQHAAGRASRYTRARLPVTLVWLRRARSWSDALRIECRIKALRRRQKDALLCGAAPLPRAPRVLARKRPVPMERCAITSELEDDLLGRDRDEAKLERLVEARCVLAPDCCGWGGLIVRHRREPSCRGRL